MLCVTRNNRWRKTRKWRHSFTNESDCKKVVSINYNRNDYSLTKKYLKKLFQVIDTYCPQLFEWVNNQSNINGSM